MLAYWYTTSDATSDGLGFDLCPPIGIDLAQSEEEPREMLLVDYYRELELELKAG